MRHYFTAGQIRAAEAPLLAGLPDGTLMRRAATGLASAIAAELRRRTGGVAGRGVCAVVGSGDNGGDALWAATFVHRRGAAASAILLNPERTHVAALAAFRSVGGRVVRAVPEGTDLVIDGVVGISGTGPLRPAAAEVFDTVDRSGIPVVAVDIPSGIDVHTGAISGPAVRAALTVTFGGLKPVHALADCGRVELVDIALELPATDLIGLEAADVKACWPIPGPHDDKYTQGVVGVAAGSSAYPGAAILCSGAAVAATSGMVRYAGPAAAEVVSHWPEVVAAPSVQTAGRVQAWVIGPGLGTDEAAFTALTFVLNSDLPVIVDADALTVLAAHPHLVADRVAPTVLTPHAGEYARFGVGSVGEDRVAAARRLAEALGATVLLKGNVTVIADPAGRSEATGGSDPAGRSEATRESDPAGRSEATRESDPAGRSEATRESDPAPPAYLNPAGGSWAATAGSGDVLSGIIGALLAAGLPAAQAAAAAAFVHARAANASAADPGPVPVPTSASRILSHIRSALANL